MPPWVLPATVYGLFDRAWAAVVAIAAAAVLLTSELDLGDWWADDAAADLAGWAYVGVMAAVAVWPASLALHRWGMALACLFWGRRTVAFLVLIFHLDRPDLWGTVAERLATLAAVLTLHVLAARRNGFVDALRSHRIDVNGARHGQPS